MTIESNIPSPSAHRVHLSIAGSAPARSADTDIDVEAELKVYEEAERERLGLHKARKQWADTMTTPQVRGNERANVTLLTSGLTAAQDFLVEGAISGQGYKVKWIGTPDAAGLRVGKEFGNRGQCNPTYFTVGTLVKHLIDLRDVDGIPTEDIIKNYVFFTAGACGPCRFGMYVTEYRKALRDAGFDGFRVMLFQQQGGLSQATGDDVGIVMNPPFFIAIVKALVAGDVLNALAYRLRPYEIERGATDRAVEDSKKILYKALFEKTNIFLALWKCRKQFASVKVDRLRARPKVSIIGEFWAMTTEGEGNYQLQRFIESEAGECDVQLISAWLLYNIWEIANDTRERSVLRHADTGPRGLDGFGELDVTRKLATMRLADRGLRLLFQSFALPLGLNGYHLPDMDMIADVAHEHYSNDLRGGEGHMEVGKLIVNAMMCKAHLTVSVKPFGCMPSSGVSDGVQSVITARHPGSLFCPVETSGDGAANFYSRVQMYMFKARQMADEELRATLAKTGVTETQVRAFLEKHPRFASPFHKPPHAVAGTASDLVYEVAPFITMTRAQRVRAKLSAVVASTSESLRRVPGMVETAVATARTPEFRAKVGEDLALLRDLATGKVREHFGPLAERLMHRAVTDHDPVTAAPVVTAAQPMAFAGSA